MRQSYVCGGIDSQFLLTVRMYTHVVCVHASYVTDGRCVEMYVVCIAMCVCVCVQ